MTKTRIIEIFHVLLFIEKIYKSDVVYDMVDIDVCHLLLGRTWQFDVNRVHKGRYNVYGFWWNSKNICLVPLMNKKKNSKAKGMNFMIIFKCPKVDNCEGYKKFKNEEEFELKIVPNKV